MPGAGPSRVRPVASVPAAGCDHLADTACIGNRYVLATLLLGPCHNLACSESQTGPGCRPARRSFCPGPGKSRVRSTSVTPVSQSIYLNRRTYFPDVVDDCGEPSLEHGPAGEVAERAPSEHPQCGVKVLVPAIDRQDLDTSVNGPPRARSRIGGLHLPSPFHPTGRAVIDLKRNCRPPTPGTRSTCRP